MPYPSSHVLIPARILEGDFAGWLRDAMAARGMSLRMLAVRSGIDHSTISRVATGVHQPTLATAVALLRVLTPKPIRFEADQDGPVDVETLNRKAS